MIETTGLAWLDKQRETDRRNQEYLENQRITKEKLDIAVTKIKKQPKTFRSKNISIITRSTQA